MCWWRGVGDEGGRGVEGPYLLVAVEAGGDAEKGFEESEFVDGEEVVVDEGGGRSGWAGD